MPLNPNDYKVLIVATHGYERSELRVPFEELKKFGADVKIASLSSDPIKSWDNGDWGDQITVDYLIKEINVQDFDCLILPG
ncbi:DJ-1/PfpI family protein, partial [Pseudochrobactrum asaccharolyticum]